MLALVVTASFSVSPASQHYLEPAVANLSSNATHGKSDAELQKVNAAANAALLLRNRAAAVARHFAHAANGSDELTFLINHDGVTGDTFSPAPDASQCSNSCLYASNGECGDGGPGAEYSSCAWGTDCLDCGPRTIQPPMPPGAPPRIAEGSAPPSVGIYIVGGLAVASPICLCAWVRGRTM